MVPFRVQLTPQEIESRGSLIPCMNQATGQFDVCCYRPSDDLLQGQPSILLPEQVSPDEEVEILGTIDTELLFPFSQQEFGSPSLPPVGPTCPVLSSLPPLSECEGRSSNCWSVGVRDLDCIQSALCCFDGCANVCMGEGPILNNGKTASLQSIIIGENLIGGNKNLQSVEASKLSEQENQQIYEANLGNREESVEVTKFAENSNLDLPQQVQPTQSGNVQIFQEQEQKIDSQDSQSVGNEDNSDAFEIDVRNTDAIVFPEESQNVVEQFNYYNNISPGQTNEVSQARAILSGPQRGNLGNDRQSTTVAVQSLQSPNEETDNASQVPDGYKYENSQTRNYVDGNIQTGQFVLSQKEPEDISLPNNQKSSEDKVQPWVQCPSAMKCVPKSFCDLTGVMVQHEIFLSPELEALRVQLIPCVNSQRGFGVDVCCRDPNYKDPWPQSRDQSRPTDDASGSYDGNVAELVGPSSGQIQELPRLRPATSTPVKVRKSHRNSYGR